MEDLCQHPQPSERVSRIPQEGSFASGPAKRFRKTPASGARLETKLPEKHCGSPFNTAAAFHLRSVKGSLPGRDLRQPSVFDTRRVPLTVLSESHYLMYFQTDDGTRVNNRFMVSSARRWSAAP